MFIITSLFVNPGEDGSVLRFRQHGGRQPERLPALPAEGDLLPATETIPAPPLPQRSHQVCVNLVLFRYHLLFFLLISSVNCFIMLHQEHHTVAPSSGSEGRIFLLCSKLKNVMM